VAQDWAQDVLTIGSWVINHWPTPLLTVGSVYGTTVKVPNRPVGHHRVMKKPCRIKKFGPAFEIWDMAYTLDMKRGNQGRRLTECVELLTRATLG
jgi:hypothetical protein